MDYMYMSFQEACAILRCAEECEYCTCPSSVCARCDYHVTPEEIECAQQVMENTNM